jgi:hypothetical protein
MTRAIDRVRRHFETKGELRRIDVAEWADEQGDPLAVFYKPLTVKTKDRLKKLNEEYGNTVEWLVNILIDQARDAQDQPLFTLEDKAVLMRRADPAIVERIATVILTDCGDIATLKKK